jgi:hypothetical protein
MKQTDEKNVVTAAKSKKQSFEKQNKRALRRSNDDSAALDQNFSETFDDIDESVPAASNNQNKGGSSNRNKYASKLMGYISSWNYREVAGGWKFNKVLQTWALDNIFDIEKMDIELFDALVPYVVTVKGASVDRLLASAEEIITEDGKDKETSDKVDDKLLESGEEKTKKRKKHSEEDSTSDSRLKRASKIKFEFSILNKTGSS